MGIEHTHVRMHTLQAHAPMHAPGTRTDAHALMCKPTATHGFLLADCHICCWFSQLLARTAGRQVHVRDGTARYAKCRQRLHRPHSSSLASGHRWCIRLAVAPPRWYLLPLDTTCNVPVKDSFGFIDGMATRAARRFVNVT